MAEGFSTSARLLATLLLLALSLAAWKWLQHSAAASVAVPMPPTPSSSAKKRSKKKPKKKSTKPAETKTEAPAPPAKAEADALGAGNVSDEDDSDSDSDDPRPASKVLATRRFKPAALGGKAAASASLTPTGPRFELGQRVFACFQGGADWFPAVVTEVRRGNLYHLRYEDGETEFHVEAAKIRADDPSEASKPSQSASSQPVGTDLIVSDAPGHQDGEDGGSDAGDADEGDEDDGWHVVSRAKPAKTSAGAGDAPEGEKLVDGLTKRQRENRRKKERQREIKEMARLQAQSGEFDARARMKYVPPPSSASQ